MNKLILMAILILPMLCAGGIVQAEDRNVEVRFYTGKAAWLDEDTPFDHTVFGASVRVYLTERLAIEPEFAYLRGPGDDRDYLIVPNISFDLFKSGNNRVFVIGGAGLIRNTAKFPGALDPEFSVNGWTATGGIGVSVHLSEHWFAGGDARFGWEPLLRFNAGIGYRF